MKKINWRKQYQLDNIFNIVILIMCLALVLFEYYIVCLLPIIVGLFINISASGFFDGRKYK